jgi:predicted anti-sigma-YlaC factor YlaD
MDEHVRDLLSAYTDGELQPVLACRVREHLSVCGVCRKELTALEDLRSLLNSVSTPAPDPLKAVNWLKTQLPNRAAATAGEPSKGAIWWFLPILMVIIALVLQIATNMTLFMLLADWAGLGGGLADLLPGYSQTTTPTQSMATLLGMSMEGNPAAILALLGTIWQSVDFLFAGIGWQMALAFVYIAWLVAVWNKRSSLLARFPRRIENQTVTIGQ